MRARLVVAVAAVEGGEQRTRVEDQRHRRAGTRGVLAERRPVLRCPDSNAPMSCVRFSRCGPTSFSIASRANRANEHAALGGALLGPLDELVVSLDQDLAHGGIVSWRFRRRGPRLLPLPFGGPKAAVRRPADVAQISCRRRAEPVADHRRHRRPGLRPRGALGRAGVPVVLGSRDPPGRRGRRARARRGAGGSFRAPGTTRPRRRRRRRPGVPFRNQSETLTNLKGALREGQIAGRRDRAAGRRGVAGRRRGRWASGRGPPPSRPRRWSPTACAW